MAEAVAGNRVPLTMKTDDMENKLMHTNNMTLETFEKYTVKLACGFASIGLLLIGLLILVAGLAGSSLSQELQPTRFSSPAEASAALFQAAQDEDEQALEAILGAGKEVASSSDEVEDKLEREQFTQKYREMHRLVLEPDGNTVLYIGAENWPFPVPLVSKDSAWHFDSDAGMQEITFRRVGENETTAIEVCSAFAAVKKLGTAPSDDDAINQYAYGLASAAASSKGNDASLFRGYYFQLVNESSVARSDSRASSSKKKNGTVALVAYPAAYRLSGVKTLIVARGTVYENDLGPDTATVAPSIRARNPGWHPVE